MKLLVWIFAIIIFASGARATTCENHLRILTGASPVILNGQTVIIKDRSLHFRVNEHDLALDYLYDVVTSLGFSAKKQTWLQHAAKEELLLLPLAGEKFQEGMSKRLTHLLNGEFHHVFDHPEDLRATYYPTIDSTTGERATRMLTNLIVDIPAAENPKTAKTILLGAHYDTINSDSLAWSRRDPRHFYHATPGADDNGSGVAGLLEILHRLKQHPIRNNNIRIVFFDGEEPGPFGFLMGSKHYINSLTLQERWRIEYAVILDMIGRGSLVEPTRYNLSAYGLDETKIQRRFLQRASYPKPLTRRPGQADFIFLADSYSFLNARIPNFLITDVMTTTLLPDHYHSLRDTVDIINFGYMYGIINQVEELIRSNDSVVLDAKARDADSKKIHTSTSDPATKLNF
jgi:hypothetical protein